MWIRHQNKKMIYNIENEIYVSSYSETEYAVYCIDYALGVYSTEEKAIKVLDMIVNYINSGGRMFVTEQHKTDFGMSAIYEKKLGVFQMPKDDEVEE